VRHRLVDFGAPAGVVNLTSHFFEFRSRRGSANAGPNPPSFLTLDQTRIETVSNYPYFHGPPPAGLYRYDINDVRPGGRLLPQYARSSSFEAERVKGSPRSRGEKA